MQIRVLSCYRFFLDQNYLINLTNMGQEPQALKSLGKPSDFRWKLLENVSDFNDIYRTLRAMGKKKLIFKHPAIKSLTKSSPNIKILFINLVNE